MNPWKSTTFPALAAVILTFCPNLTRAEVSGNFEYSVNGDAVTITDYFSSGNVVIPAMIDGKPVTEIGDEAFFVKSVYSITIPSTVTRIGARAFYVGYDGPTLVIPPTVTHIGDEAFARCMRLQAVTVPASLKETGVDVFSGCSGLKSVTLEPGLAEIGPGMFNYCWSLPQITIPASVTRIGDRAFAGCRSIADLRLSSGLSEIGDRAFEGCAGLKDIAIPSTVTRIGDQAFFYCRGLGSISIPGSVDSIGDEAFYQCPRLGSVTFGNGIRKIGSKAFSQNPITRIDLPDSLIELGIGTFEDCVKLAKVSLSNALVEIPDRAFYGCKSLHKVVIPASVKRIGVSAFQITGLNSIELGKSLREIDDYAFADCNGLSRMTFPPKVLTFGQRVFAGCGNLKSLIFTGKAPQEFVHLFSRLTQVNSEIAIYLDKGATGFTVPRWKGFVTHLATPEIAVRIEQQPYLVDGAAKVRFPGAIVATGTSTRRITIENLGNLKLRKLSARISGKNQSDFSVKNLTKSFLAPGKSAELEIEFSPHRKGTSAATLELFSNDTNEGVFEVEISGRGVILVR